MNLIRLIFAACVVTVCATPVMAESLSLGERATLQATMQRHIEASLVDGRYLHLDPESGAVKVLLPSKSHPMILSMGEHFVLCAEFFSTDGAHVNVDFFLARQDDGFIVFSSQVENRRLVARLLQNGGASRIQ